MPAYAYQPWLWPINGEVRETLAWATDVLTAENGNEQRIRLVNTPRRIVEQSHTLTADQRPRAENALWADAAEIWGLPLWMDVTRLASLLSAGETVIPVAALHRDYQVGGSLVLMTSPDAFEVCDIEAVTDTTVSVTGPTADEWPAGTMIAPLKFGRLPLPQRLTRFDGGTATGSFAFELVDLNPWPVADETSGGYRGRPVITDRTDWQQDVAQDYSRPYEEFGNGLSPPLRDLRGGPGVTQVHGYTVTGRAAIGAFRSHLYARYGRQRGVWLPSQARDLRLVTSAAAIDTTIDATRVDYTATVDADIGRRDLQILLADDTRICRRVTSSSPVSASVERFVLDSALGVAIDPDDVVAISWMTPARLEADNVELRWWTWDTVNAQIQYRGTRDDV